MSHTTHVSGVSGRLWLMPQGGLEVLGLADAILDLGQVLGRVVAGGPVGPDPVDEREVIGSDDVLGHLLHLEVPKVERPLDLVVGDDVLAEDGERRDVEDDQAPPPSWFLAGRAQAPTVPQSCAMRIASESPSSASCSAIWSATMVLECTWWRSSG